MITPEDEKQFDQLHPMLPNDNYGSGLTSSNDNSNNQLIEPESQSIPPYESVMQQNINMYPPQNMNNYPPQQNINMMPQQNINMMPQQNINMMPQQNINMIPQQNINMIPQQNINMIPQQNINMAPQNPQPQVIFVQSSSNPIPLSGNGVQRISSNQFSIFAKVNDSSSCCAITLITLGCLFIFTFYLFIIGIIFLILGIKKLASKNIYYIFTLNQNNIQVTDRSGFSAKESFYLRGQIDKIDFFSTLVNQGNDLYNEYHLRIQSNQTAIELLNLKTKKPLFTPQEMSIFTQAMNNHINSWKTMPIYI